MNKEEMKRKYTERDVEKVIDFVGDYLEMLTEEEPDAVNTIRLIEKALAELPISMDEI